VSRARAGDLPWTGWRGESRVRSLADPRRHQSDLNVIDHAALRLHKPVITHDLPAGGRRQDQTANGYVATIVSGQVIAEHDVPNDARPDRLVRGERSFLGGDCELCAHRLESGAARTTNSAVLPGGISNEVRHGMDESARRFRQGE
jgi:hypothetical protein